MSVVHVCSTAEGKGPSVRARSESAVSSALETRNDRMFPVAVPFTT